MIRMVISNYRTLFQWNVCKKYIGEIIIFCYWMLFFPIIYRDKDMIEVYSFVLAVLFALTLSRVCSNRLPKLFYICPIDQEERKQYIKTGYWIRLSTPLVCYLLVSLVLIILKMMSLTNLMVGFLHLALLSAELNLYIGWTDEVQRKSFETRTVVPGMNKWQYITGIPIVWSYLIYLALVNNNQFNRVLFGIWCIIFLLIAEMILHSIRKYFSKMVEAVLNYEKVIDLNGKRER